MQGAQVKHKMKITKDQAEVIRKYAKENGITVEQAINYMVSFLEQEMGDK